MDDRVRIIAIAVVIVGTTGCLGLLGGNSLSASLHTEPAPNGTNVYLVANKDLPKGTNIEVTVRLDAGTLPAQGSVVTPTKRLTQSVPADTRIYLGTLFKKSGNNDDIALHIGEPPARPARVSGADYKLISLGVEVVAPNAVTNVRLEDEDGDHWAVPP